jgi:multiple sugar transport system ATP-binding protein
VVLGIRPSNFEDAALADPGWPRIPVAADVTEELGTEILVMFVIDAPAVEHKDTAALAADAEEEDAAIPVAAGKSMWTARVSPHSKITTGNRMELSIDTSNLHFFDPGSGLAIGYQRGANTHA